MFHQPSLPPGEKCGLAPLCCRSELDFDEFESIPVRVPTKNRPAPRTTASKGNRRVFQPLLKFINTADVKRRMPVTSGVDRSGFNWVRILQLEQMNLLLTHLQPGAGKTQIGSRGIHFLAEYVAVKHQSPLAVRDQQTDVMDTQEFSHLCSPIWACAAR